MTPSIDGAGLEMDEAIRAGRYERNEADFIRRSVHQGDTAIDLGAHIGVHTTLLADLVGSAGFGDRHRAGEAHVARLDAAVRGSGVADRVTIVTAAAGAAAGERSLLVSAPGQASHNAWLMPPGRATGPLDGVEHVRVVRVDDVPRRGRVSFMKIDVEGAEALALAGASALLASDRPVLLVDLHPHLMPIVSGESAGGLDRATEGLRLRVPSARCRRARPPGSMTRRRPPSRRSSSCRMPSIPGLHRVPAGNPGPLTGQGNWTYLVTGRVPTIVDAGVGLAAHIETIAAVLDGVGQRLRQIVVTHIHRDHSSGAAALLARWPEARCLKLAVER